jgi:hypothetical protein
MSTVIDTGDEFRAARVCGGVTTVSEPVQVFGADTLWAVCEQSVWCSVGQSYCERVAFGDWDTEDVGLDPFGRYIISDA